MAKVRRSHVIVNIKASDNVRVSVNVRAAGTRRKPLKFGRGNNKLKDENIHTFSLPAGHFCPFAKQCLSLANRQTGKIKDGQDTVFRCYAASMEVRPSIRRARWYNWEQLKNLTREKMVGLISDSLSPFAGVVRLHVAGDFFSQDYFDAWLAVAVLRPRTLFYGYTKSLTYWVRRKASVPANLVLTASCGGKLDPLIGKHDLRFAKVVFSKEEADRLGLEIDTDDSHAMRNDGRSFGLLIHGTQPAGSEAGKAWSGLRQSGEGGYGDVANNKRMTLQMI